MKRAVFFAFFLAVGVALMLAAVYLLLNATLRIPANGVSLKRALLVTGDVLLGVLALVGSTFIATHVAVQLFGKDSADKK